MFSLNRIQLIGYVTEPVELRQTPNGQSVTDINLATPYAFKVESGEALSSIAYHSITAWGGMAETAAQYLKPGSQCFVSGRLQTDTWEDAQSGERRSKTRIVAMDMVLLDPKSGQLELPERGKPLTGCLNRADIIGNLTRDPEMRTTTSGQHVLTLGIATNERWRDKTSNELRERAEFHNVVLWGELALLASEHCRKGMRVHACGRVQTRSWETKQGSKRTTTEIIADALSILGVRNADITYSSIARAERLAARATAQSPAREVESESPPATANFDVPEISYERGIKVEDLPF